MDSKTQKHKYYPENATLEWQLDDVLDVNTIGQLQNIDAQFIKKYAIKNLVIKAEQLSYCDTAGMTFLLDLQNKLKQVNVASSITGLTKPLQALYDNFARLPKTTQMKKASVKYNFIARLGKGIVDFTKTLKQNTLFIGEVCHHLIFSITHPSAIRWKETLNIIQIVGPDAVPLSALIGFLLGIILSFQAVVQLRMFGAEIYVADLVSISLVRELGPLMTAIVLTGRTASAFAAELSTMKINQEIDAIKVMNLVPVRFLVLPRIIAATIMTPLLSLVVDIFGIIGCLTIMASEGYIPRIVIHEMIKAVDPMDIIGGVIKTVVFGILIAGIACQHGLRAGSNAAAVGRSTTSTVVSCIVMITIADGIFTTIYYYLGI
ncbi:MAG: MlaE family ABC transporter permease [Gammaproteobacteria bacterium]